MKPRQATSSADKAARLFTPVDASAFEFVYLNYFAFVRNLCRRMLRDPVQAEDAAQDVFVCVLRKINTFRGESAFSSWLCRLTINSVLMRFRRKHHARVPLEDSPKEDGVSCDEIGAPDLNLSGLLDRIDLPSAIDILPNGYKTAFLLHDVHGYGHREIAEICGNSVGNSKSHVHKARLRLRKLLSGHTREVRKQNTIPASAPELKSPPNQ